MLKMTRFMILGIFFCLTRAQAMERVLQRAPHVQKLQSAYNPSSSAQKHQAALVYLIEQHTHHFYAALNCIKENALPAAITALQNSQQSLQELAILLDPHYVIQNDQLNSMAHELKLGVAHINAHIARCCARLQEADVRKHDIVEKLEQIIIFRKSLFYACMQWDTRLSEIIAHINALRLLIDATQKSFACQRSWIKNRCVELFGASYQHPLTNAQATSLKQQFALLEKLLREGQRHFELESKEYDDFQEMIVLCRDTGSSRLLAHRLKFLATDTKNLNFFHEKLILLQDALEKCNKNLLTFSCKSLRDQEYTILAEMQEIQKSSMFLHKNSFFTKLHQSGADVVVTAAETTLHISYETQRKIEQLETLCVQLSKSFGIGGSFEKHINAGIELAQTLQNEKAIIKTIAHQMQDFHIEKLVGLTNLLQRIAALVQDIAKNDTAWSTYLQKLNPELHAFLRSCEKEKVQETLAAAEEISKTLKIKQPISRAALICAKHGSTIKLTLEGLKLLLQQCVPFFEVQSKSFHSYANIVAELSDKVQIKGQETLLASLTAEDIAHALQKIAQAHREVDTYQKCSHVDKYPPVHKDRENFDVTVFYNEMADLYNQIFEIEFILAQNHISELEYAQVQERYTALQQRMRAHNALLSSALEAASYKRGEKYEPAHAEELFGFYKDMALLAHEQHMIERTIKTATSQIMGVQSEIDNLWGPFHRNITTIVIYIWNYFTYINYWMKKKSLLRKKSLLTYQKKCWEELNLKVSQHQERLVAEIVSDDLALRKYFKALDPTLFAFL